MERSNYFSDEYVYSDDLNNTESTKAHQLILRTQAPLGYSSGYSLSSASVYQGGIYGSPASYLLPVNCQCASIVPGGSVLTVYSGTALSPAGEVIIIPSTPQNFVTIGVGTAGATYNWTATPNVLNYVKLSYQETSGSLGADDLGNVFATEYYGSYFITVDGTLPNPATQILLSTFTADSAGRIVTGPIDCREYVSTITPATSVILDPTTKLVSSFVTAADHINAKGSGVATVKNAHGLTLADLGASDGTAGHRIEAHAACIIDITGAYPAGVFFNSWQPSMSGVSGSGPTISIQFASGAANAAILADGNVYPGLSVPSQPLVSNPLFPVTSVPTQYWVYIDGTGTINATTTALSDTYNNLTYTTPDIFVLCTITISNGGVDYSNFVDLRRFYPNMPAKTQADFFDTYSPGSFPSLGIGSTLVTTLQRIRWQLGMAIDGNGGDWGVTPPLTAGAASLADVYHTHSGTHSFSFAINNNGGALDINNPILCLNRGGASVQAAMQWNTTTKSLVFYSNVNAGTSYGYSGTWATGSFAAVQVGTSSISNNAAGALLSVLEGGPASNADALHTHSAGIPKFANVSVHAISVFAIDNLSPFTSSWQVNGNATALMVTMYVQMAASAVADIGLSVLWSASGGTSSPPDATQIALDYIPANGVAGQSVVQATFIIPSGQSWAFTCTTSTSSPFSCSGSYTIFD
jgi:hypothetical protein